MKHAIKNGKVPFTKGKFSRVKNVRYLSGKTLLMSSSKMAFAFWNHTRRFDVLTRFVRQQNFSDWKLRNGVTPVFLFTTTMAKSRKFPGRSSASFRRVESESP